jgi:hypothetical protein
MLRRLEDELGGPSTPDGPVIFEIPLKQADRIDVLAVWQAFERLESEDRSRLILDAYGDRRAQIAQALGVTPREAEEQQLLPYAVVPITRRGDADEEPLKQAMLAEGGIRRDGGAVELRLPTMAMAEDVHRRLRDRFPQGYWSIVQTVGYVE